MPSAGARQPTSELVLSGGAFPPHPHPLSEEAADTGIAEELSQQMVAAGFDEVRVRCRH